MVASPRLSSGHNQTGYRLCKPPARSAWPEQAARISSRHVLPYLFNQTSQETQRNNLRLQDLLADSSELASCPIVHWMIGIRQEQ